jgi:hypothetical protein
MLLTDHNLDQQIILNSKHFFPFLFIVNFLSLSSLQEIKFKLKFQLAMLHELKRYF